METSRRGPGISMRLRWSACECPTNACANCCVSQESCAAQWPQAQASIASACSRWSSSGKRCSTNSRAAMRRSRIACTRPCTRMHCCSDAERWTLHCWNSCSGHATSAALGVRFMAGPDLSKRIVYGVDGMRDVRVQRDVVYKRDAGTELLMNIYAPAALPDSAPAPVVFFVHGGPIASDFMPPTQWGVFVSHGELAAASGLVGVTFNHRLFAVTDYERSQSDVAAAIDYV